VIDRPETWDEFVGQEELKERLKVHISSAIIRLERMDHVLLVGPAGCGKTTLSALIASSLGYEYARFVMPLTMGALKNLVIQHRGLVMFDELHRCSPKEQESLLALVEDGWLQMPSGMKIPAQPFFTIVGATTEPDEIIKPLYDRFHIKPSFEDYSDEEMAEIVFRMAIKEDVDITEEFAVQLGRASGGLPRNAEALISLTRDQFHDWGRMPMVEEVLKMAKVTPTGLSRDQVEYLKVLRSVGSIAGIDTLVAHLNLPKSTVVENERLLVRQNLIIYTKSGREITSAGFNVAKEVANA